MKQNPKLKTPVCHHCQSPLSSNMQFQFSDGDPVAGEVVFTSICTNCNTPNLVLITGKEMQFETTDYDEIHDRVIQIIGGGMKTIPGQNYPSSSEPKTKVERKAQSLVKKAVKEDYPGLFDDLVFDRFDVSFDGITIYIDYSFDFKGENRGMGDNGSLEKSAWYCGIEEDVSDDELAEFVTGEVCGDMYPVLDEILEEIKETKSASKRPSSKAKSKPIKSGKKPISKRIGIKKKAVKKR